MPSIPAGRPRRKVPISRRRTHQAALIAVAAYALIGPAIHPGVALASPLRTDLLCLAAVGLWC